MSRGSWVRDPHVYTSCIHTFMLFQMPSRNSGLAARLAQLGERRSAEREVVSSNLGRTNTQGLKITEEKVLSL